MNLENIVLSKRPTEDHLVHGSIHVDSISAETESDC